MPRFSKCDKFYQLAGKKIMLRILNYSAARENERYNFLHKWKQDFKYFNVS